MKITLLSDRQKGLIEGCSVVFPDSSHGYCLRHLQENFHKKFKHPDLKNLLWDAARATKQEDFDDALSKMSKIDSEAVPWLLSHASPEHWAELYFTGKVETLRSPHFQHCGISQLLDS